MENNDTLEVIQRIPLDKLRPYPDHPFGVRDDDMMQQTVESVKQFGVLVPGIARPLPDGTFELIAGHRRKQASAVAGLDDMPIIVRGIDRNAATIIMVDSNLQRENILPSEKAKAYKMKLEAIKRQAGRPGKNSAQVGQNVAYRKSGYSKKFLEEHEADIIIHKAAKKAFDEMGVKKLPTVKSLQVEFADLLTAKKEAYAELKKVRDELRDLTIHKANYEELRDLEEREKRKEKEHGRELSCSI